MVLVLGIPSKFWDAKFYLHLAGYFFAWSGELCCGVVAISREVSPTGFQFRKQRKEDANVTVVET